MKDLKKPGLLFFSSISMVLLLFGCSGDKLAGDIDVEWEADERSYKAIVKDDEGTARVQLICQYVGKAPEEPLDTEVRRNWKMNDTDFYHYQLVNLTDEPVELVNVSFRLKNGKGGKIYDTKTQVAIDKDWGGHIIPARGKLSRRNAFVWGKSDENVLHKIYLAKSGGNSFEIDTQLVYKRRQ